MKCASCPSDSCWYPLKGGWGFKCQDAAFESVNHAYTPSLGEENSKPLTHRPPSPLLVRSHLHAVEEIDIIQSGKKLREVKTILNGMINCFFGGRNRLFLCNLEYK